MIYSARPAHCNGKPEGNLVRPSLGGPVSVLDRYNPRYGHPSHCAHKATRQKLVVGDEETGHPT